VQHKFFHKKFIAMTVKATSNKSDGSTIYDHVIPPFRKDEGRPTKLTKDNVVMALLGQWS
jgi:hypothetical protein